MPLLLQDEPIENSTKDVLNKIINQLEVIKNLINDYPKLTNNFTTSILKIIDPILEDKDKAIFKLETFFNSKYSYEKFSVVASLVDLNKEEISQLEKSYNYPYYKKIQINAKDENIYKALLDNIKYRDDTNGTGTYELLQQAKGVYSNLTQREKDVKPLLCLVNARIKVLDLKQSKWSDFNNLVHSVYIEQLIQSETPSKKKDIDLNYFIKLFNLPPIGTDVLNNKEEVKKGLALTNLSFTKEYGNLIKLNTKRAVYNLHDFKQVSALEFSKWGGKVYEDQVKDSYFFTNEHTAIVVPKSSAIIDVEPTVKYQSSSNKYSDTGLGKYVSPQENNPNNLQLNYEGMKKIRLAMFEDVPKWQPGSFIKINEDMIYVLRTPYPDSHPNTYVLNDRFVVECIYLSMSNNDYYHKKIELTKSDVEKSRKLDPTERLMCFQFLDSCYQSEVQSRNYVMMEKRLRY